MEDRPNICVILTDQLSANALAHAGNAWVKTPNIDRLAGKGLRFENSYSVAPVCVPWRTALMQGRYPREVAYAGTMTRMSGPDGKVACGLRPEYEPERLGRVMADHGYRCAYAGKWHVETWGPTESLPEGDHPHGFERLSVMNDDAVAQATGSFLKGYDGQKPFFLVASFSNPHDICEWMWGKPLPEGPIQDQAEPARLPPLPDNICPSEDEPEALQRLRELRTSRLDTSDAGWRLYRWSYYRLIEKVDRLVGEVLRQLEAGGFLDNTYIFFTSDHGDHQGEHGLPQKESFYEASAHVPLIAYSPFRRRRGELETALVSNALDLNATIREIAGAPVLDGAPGVSLLGLIDGTVLSMERDHIVSELEERFTGSLVRMVRTCQYKYIRYAGDPGGEQLFDMAIDSDELTNLVKDPAHAGVLKQHRELLDSWETSQRARLATH